MPRNRPPHGERWTSSFRFQLLSSSILVYLVTTIFLALFLYVTQVSNMRERLGLEKDYLLDSISGSLTLPLWNFDLEASKNILASAMGYPDLRSVSAFDERGAFIGGAERDGSGKIRTLSSPIVAEPGPTPEFAGSKRISYGGSVIGRIDVAVTDEFAMALLIRQLWKSIALSSIVILAGINTLFFIDLPKRKRAETEHLARVAAEIANKTKSDFLSNMSHELRTPLNSIIGFTEVLQDALYGEMNEKQREYLGYINTSGRHLLDLINDILDLSKVESGRTEVNLSAVSVRAVLELSMTMLRERALKRAIALECSIAPEADVDLVSDGHKIKQVVFNLLSNAVKFTPDGGRVSIDARRTEGGFIGISVTDTGIGIKEEDLGRLFKEFSQLESPLQKRYEGTGLGLVLSKRLMEMLGGSIAVRSQEGVGSVFSIAIPLVPPSVKASSSAGEGAA
jgi:signal transduction histidine kinase